MISKRIFRQNDPGDLPGHDDDQRRDLSPGDEHISPFIQTQIIPSLYDRERDYVIDNKKRLNCFTNTDLEHLLRILGVKTVVLTGINTNTCVLNTAFSALDRDFAVVVISDCVASMYGDDLHALGADKVREIFIYLLVL